MFLPGKFQMVNSMSAKFQFHTTYLKGILFAQILQLATSYSPPHFGNWSFSNGSMKEERKLHQLSQSLYYFKWFAHSMELWLVKSYYQALIGSLCGQDYKATIFCRINCKAVRAFASESCFLLRMGGNRFSVWSEIVYDETSSRCIA